MWPELPSYIGKICFILGVFLAIGWAIYMLIQWRAGNLLVNKHESTTNQESEIKVERWSLVEFFRYAWDHKWNLSLDKWRIFDLLDGLRQAGVENTIQFYGRLSPNEPIVYINRECWINGGLESFGIVEFKMGDTVGVLGDNRQTSFTHADKNISFVDIYLDKEDSIQWLKNDAEKYRGVTAREKTEEELNQGYFNRSFERTNADG